MISKRVGALTGTGLFIALAVGHLISAQRVMKSLKWPKQQPHLWDNFIRQTRCCVVFFPCFMEVVSLQDVRVSTAVDPTQEHFGFTWMFLQFYFLWCNEFHFSFSWFIFRTGSRLQTNSKKKKKTWPPGFCQKLARGSSANPASVCRFRSYAGQPWRRGIEVHSLLIISIPLLVSIPQDPLPCPVHIMLRFLPIKLGRLYRCLKLLLVVGLFVILLMNTHNLFASFQKNELTDRRFINLNKCPACFGTSWCRKFMNGQVSFETWGRLRFLDVFNVKNVYFAQYGEPREGTRRVVLKRLGSNQELAEIDQKICKRATGRPRCDIIQAMYKTEFARINGDVRLLTPDVVEGWSDLVHCPSQRLLDRVVRRYAETKDSGSFLLKNLKDTERMQLLMTLAFNPEPLVLQVLYFSLSFFIHLSFLRLHMLLQLCHWLNFVKESVQFFSPLIDFPSLSRKRCYESRLDIYWKHFFRESTTTHLKFLQLDCCLTIEFYTTETFLMKCLTCGSESLFNASYFGF